jgi:Fe(3+) dicitrate transport protein
MLFKSFLTVVTLSIFSFSQAQETPKKDTLNLNEVIISSDALLGSKFKAKNKAGSSYFISPAELKKFNYDDVSRILRTIPGVSIQEEEGFGLRPNIGMRGTSPNRNEKITVMEDGVLIAPAPYSAPAAYYFPTIARLQSFEILKGGSQIQYGPYTTGGAINMVSAQIPTSFSGTINSSVGRFNTKKTYVNIGDTFENFGYLIEYNNRNSDGFKTIDNSQKKTGFQGNDYVGKFKLNSKLNAKLYQSLTLKLQFSEDISNETYLGLTQTDSDANPYRRYAASNEDYIDTEHKQIMLTHLIKPTTNFSVTTKAYRNDFARNWYKLDYVKLGANKISINSILEKPETYAAEYTAIKGESATANNTFGVKANNREYEARGIQTVGNYNFSLGKTTNELDFGIRYHEDYEDRFQWVDGYKMQNGTLLKTSLGAPGTDANKITSAKAIATHILWNINYKKFTFSPGIRYENIKLQVDDYKKNDVNRTGFELAVSKNKTDVWIPGLGILYNYNQNYTVFGSIHKGFSPPGAIVGEDAESSINTELGLRANKNKLSSELVLYYNGFSNLQGSDNMSSGGTGTGDLFNAGKASVKGIEFLVSYELCTNKELKLPVSFTYTLTDTNLQTNFTSSIWGNVSNGDEIPYIAKNQFALTAGFEFKKWQANLSGKYNDAFRTIAGQGTIDPTVKVNRNFIVDATLKYFVTKKVAVTSNVINLFDQKYAVSRVPAGLRPGHPFGINLGIMARF